MEIFWLVEHLHFNEQEQKQVHNKIKIHKLTNLIEIFIYSLCITATAGRYLINVNVF